MTIYVDLTSREVFCNVLYLFVLDTQGAFYAVLRTLKETIYYVGLSRGASSALEVLQF